MSVAVLIHLLVSGVLASKEAALLLILIAGNKFLFCISVLRETLLERLHLSSLARITLIVLLPQLHAFDVTCVARVRVDVLLDLTAALTIIQSHVGSCHVSLMIFTSSFNFTKMK